MRVTCPALILTLAALAPGLVVAQGAPAAPPPTAAATPAPSGWTPLFNGRDLDGWTANWAKAPVDDRPASSLFTVENGVLRVYAAEPAGSAQQQAYLQTNADYGDYRLSLEYKWGEKKYPPRMDALRDSGVIYHIWGARPLDWAYGVEAQIQEGDTGDIIVISTQGTSEVLRETQRYAPAKEGGVTQTIGQFGRSVKIRHGALNELPGQWNTLEIVVRGDTATHIVNGFVNLRVTGLKKWDQATSSWVRLDRGKIALQAEFAEVSFRNIRIRPLRPDEMQ